MTTGRCGGECVNHHRRSASSSVLYNISVTRSSHSEGRHGEATPASCLQTPDSTSLPSAFPSLIFTFGAFDAAVTMTPFSRLTAALSHLAASVLADLLFPLPFAAICSPLLLCHASYALYTPPYRLTHFLFCPFFMCLESFIW